MSDDVTEGVDCTGGIAALEIGKDGDPPSAIFALDLAQAAMNDRQFEAFRRLFLKQFGKDGLESDLKRLVAEH